MADGDAAMGLVHVALRHRRSQGSQNVAPVSSLGEIGILRTQRRLRTCLVSVAADEAVDGVLAAPPEGGLERLAVHLRRRCGEHVDPFTGMRSAYRRQESGMGLTE